MKQPMIEEEKSPLDSIISRVDSYIKDPAMVTSATLTELKEELLDLKGYMDGESGESLGESSEEASEHNGKGGRKGLSIIIGGMK